MCDTLLASYQGRDGLIKTIGYTCMLAGGLTEGGIQRRFQTMSREMSQCRVVLRMLDDWPMLKYSMQYGLGKSEEDQIHSLLSTYCRVPRIGRVGGHIIGVEHSPSYIFAMRPRPGNVMLRRVNSAVITG